MGSYCSIYEAEDPKHKNSVNYLICSPNITCQQEKENLYMTYSKIQSNHYQATDKYLSLGISRPASKI